MFKKFLSSFFILEQQNKCYTFCMNVYDLLHKELKRLDIKEETTFENKLKETYNK